MEYIHEKSVEIISSLWLSHKKFEPPLSWYYWRELFERHAVESISYGIVFIPSFMTISSAIQRLLRLIPQKFESLQCSCYRWEGFFKHVFEMASDDLICTPNFVTIGSSTQVILRLLPQKSESLSAGNTDWRHLRRMPLRWLQMAWYTYHVSWRFLETFKYY